MGVPSWKTASSRSFIVHTVMSSLDVMAVAIQGSASPFSLSMKGVPNTCVENSLLPPPSRHGAIVLTHPPDGCRHNLRVVQVQARRCRARPWLDATCSRGGCGGWCDGGRRFGCGLWPQRGIRRAWAPQALLARWPSPRALPGRTARGAACGVSGSAGSSPPHPAARTDDGRDGRISTRNIGLEMVDAAWPRIWDTSSAWRRRRW